MFILQYTTADVRQGEAGRDQITIITQIENMKEAHLPAAKVPELKKKMFKPCRTAQPLIPSDIPLLFTRCTTALLCKKAILKRIWCVL